MEDRRGFLKHLGIGVGAGAFALTLPQLTNGHNNPVIDRFVPTAKLLDRNMIYAFRNGLQRDGGEWVTANPRDDYRAYLVDLWASNGNLDLLNGMVDKCLELATTQDTRGWDVNKWNDEIRETHETITAELLLKRWKNGRKS